jgi:hypothetical protein
MAFIRIRKKFPRVAFVVIPITILVYSWISYSRGVSIDLVIGVAIFTSLVAAGACMFGATMIRRHGGKPWPDDGSGRPSASGPEKGVVYTSGEIEEFKRRGLM